MKPKQLIVAATLLVISMFGTATPQEVNHRLLHANGQGTLKVGQEQFKVNGVVVKLLDDQKAEITLIADITIFISGTWSRNADSQEAFDLQITGGASPGGLEGSGKLTLGKDKDVRLNLKGKSRTTKKNVEVYFVGK
ncbi:MAG TPA: hypothetical protein VLB46_13910 [Pyrinomonadaceae bacterium]|nr:hypothetical protein [Pyrinomonadaceae bacterium]